MSILRDGTHFRACNLCEAICGLKITVHGGRVTDLRGDPDDPLSRGAICPKGPALIDLHADPDRLRAPQIRTKSGWHTHQWDDALDFAVNGLREVIATHSPDAIAFYVGNPTVHNSGTLLGWSSLLKAIGTSQRYSATSVDQLPHHVAAQAILGHHFLLPIPDIDRTDFFFVLGANPIASNGSLMTAPGVRDRIRALQSRGGRLVVVDPRRTETAAIADEHYFITPGTDALLLLAMLHVIFTEHLVDLGRLADCTDGLQTLAHLVADFSPHNVSARCGIRADQIIALARSFAGANRAVAYGRMGLSTQAFGGLCQWLIIVLNSVTGNLDEPGGAMFTEPAFDLVRMSRSRQPVRRSRVRGLLEFDGEFPVATLADEILTPGPGQIRALITIAGNPVLSTPNGTRLDEALASLDFMLSIDPYRNETTRHAHVILPPAVGLETEHYDAVFHHFAVRNTARVNEPIAILDEDQRYDYQIFAALSQRLGASASPTPMQRIDAALAAGPRATSLAELRAHPHGVDYGPLRSVLPERLCTEGKRINLVPPTITSDLARLAAQSAPKDTLLLIGRRQLRSNNSWMHNTPRLMRGADRCTIIMNPGDAADRSLTDGELVEIATENGQITVPLEVSSEMMPGVVCLPHGFGHNRDGIQLDVASEKPGASYNDLTGGLAIDTLTGNAALNGIPVHVTRASGQASMRDASSDDREHHLAR